VRVNVAVAVRVGVIVAVWVMVPVSVMVGVKVGVDVLLTVADGDVIPDGGNVSDSVDEPRPHPEARIAAHTRQLAILIDSKRLIPLSLSATWRRRSLPRR